MALFRLDDAMELMGEHTPPCISMMFPTIKAGAETAQNSIRFKNMFRQAQQVLENQGMRKPQLEKLFDPALPLLEDTMYWQDQGDSFALFLSSDIFKKFRIPQRIEERLVVGPRFYMKPILPLFFEDARFYVLAISQKKVRLFQGAKDGIREVELVGVPTDIDEVVKQFVEERHIVWHMLSGVRSGDRGQPYFHGQGAPSLHSEDKILQYFYQVDKGISAMLREEKVPLIFAGVEYLFPAYREVNTYSNLYGDFISGNPDRISPGELHEEAIKLLKPYFEQTKTDALEKYYQFAGTGHTASANTDVIKSAVNAKVEALFIAKDAKVFGQHDPKSNDVQLHAKQTQENEDLLDLSVRETFLGGGRVYQLNRDEMPDKADMAAILRY